MRFHTLLLLIFLFSVGCTPKVVEKISQSKSESIGTVSIVQNGKAQRFDPGTHIIVINKDAFSIQFNNYHYTAEKRHSARLLAFSYDLNFSEISVGMNIKNNEYLGDGRGKASNEGGFYESIFIDTKGCHYLLYENEDSQRLNLISEEDDLLKLGFDIANVTIKGETKTIGNSALNKLCLVLFVDRNLNYIIDEGELTKLTVVFRRS